MVIVARRCCFACFTACDWLLTFCKQFFSEPLLTLSYVCARCHEHKNGEEEEHRNHTAPHAKLPVDFAENFVVIVRVRHEARARIHVRLIGVERNTDATDTDTSDEKIERCD